MTTQEAIATLEQGGDWPALAEAIGVVSSDPMTSFDALLLGLKYPGVVAEQAALGLYRRTFRPIPDNRRELLMDPDEWRELTRKPKDVTEDNASATRGKLAEWITHDLSRNERLILVSYYSENHSMAEIGKRMGLSESQVSEIHKSILKRLRERLGATLIQDLQKIA